MIPGTCILLLEPQSRFGDKLLEIRVVCPQQRGCGSKRVNIEVHCELNVFVLFVYAWYNLCVNLYSRGRKANLYPVPGMFS